MSWWNHRRTHKWLASFACATAVACGGGSDDDVMNGGQPGAQDAGQVGQVTNGGQTSVPGTGMGTGTGTGTPMSMQTAQDAGTGTTKPVVDAGPVDLGENSAGDTFLRADTLVLKAPNLYATLIIRLDATAQGQEALNTLLTTDGDNNGFVDMSMLLRFLGTSTPAQGSSQVTPGGAVCPMPVGPTAACGPDKTFPFQRPALAYSNSAQNCMLMGTQESAPAPCFATAISSLTMQLPLLGAVPLQDGQIVGTWSGAEITNGYVRGFLPKTVAAATKLGEGVPPEYALAGVKTGAPLTDFLSDAQLGKNGKGEDGWWFLMTYTAKPAKFDPAAKVP